ncbi:hypothetical protein [Rhizobacter sp. P5_C2]
MTLKSLLAAVGVALLATSLGAANSTLPEGWMRAGDAAACRHGVRDASAAPTPRVFFIDCPAQTTGFATVMQQVSAGRHAGQRLRLRAQLKITEVQGWAGVWLRADKGGRSVAFDNMQGRALHGSTGWQAIDVVLDIPPGTETLSFGFLTEGAGQADATQFSLDPVGTDVPVTAMASAPLTRIEPQHLSPP